MRFILYPVAALFLLLQTATGEAQQVTVHAIDPLYVNSQNIVSPGRAYMRRPNGELVGTVIHSSPQISVLYHSESYNDGYSWELEKLAEVRSDNPSTEFNPSVDSNRYGKYVAYSVPIDGNRFVGQIAHKQIDGISFAVSDVSNPKTPESNSVSKSFIAASRGADERGNFLHDVGYGWVDESTGDVFVGHSDTGIEFPPAKLIHSDTGLVGGVSIAVAGDFLLVVFHSTNERYQPVGLAHKTGAFPVLMESHDGGDTWTEPQPLFGLSIKDFPVLSSENNIVLAGGTLQTDIVANALAWARPEKGEKNIYVTSAIQPVARGASETWVPLSDGRSSHIGIVSSRDFNSQDRSWRHAVVHDVSDKGARLASDTGVSGFQIQMNYGGLSSASVQTPSLLSTSASLHQYSALPGSPVRTLTYLENTSLSETNLVVGISTDSGATYDRYVRVSIGNAAAPADPALRFSVSQCLFGDPGGNIFIDVVLAGGERGVGLRHMKIPLGLNVKELKG